MGLIKAKFIERVKRTPSVESLRFLPQERFEFIPGQFLQLVFDEQDPNNKDLNKYLSFSSSPDKGYIEVTKRLSESAFSGKLRALKPGDPVSIKAPMGNCVFKQDDTRIAFLIGGIGITPVISILEYIVERNLTTDAYLVYSNRTEEEIAFKNELDAWQMANGNIKVLYLVTDCQPRDKRCIFGRIDKDLLSERIEDLNERKVFIFGPPKMVEAISAVCLQAGARQENIKTENFLGY